MIVEFRARRTAAAHIGDAERAVFGHEHAIRHNVVAAGAGHAIDMPGIEHRDGGNRDQAEAHIGRACPIRHRGGGQHPIGMHDAGAPFPVAAELIAAFHRGERSGRCGDAGCDNIRERAAKGFVLRLLREQRQHPIVFDTEGGDPAGGGAAFGQRQHDVDERFGIELQTTIDLGHEVIEHTGLTDCLPHRIDRMAQAFSFPRVSGEQRRQGGCALAEDFRCQGCKVFARKPVASGRSGFDYRGRRRCHGAIPGLFFR